MTTEINQTFHQIDTLNNYLNRGNQYLQRLDKELSKIEYANQLERKIGIPKSYLVAGVSLFFLAFVILDRGAKILTSAMAWIYPAYASFKTIESPSRENDTQWLTYWTVIAFFHMIEYFSDILLFWFPFYYTFKIIFILWLILPQFQGAQFVYSRVLRPFLLGAQPEIERRKTKFNNTLHAATAMAKTM
ncbi:TB2/DP1, HVA22 family-domain-containing protein [Choanephora cucurbitarum]|nr:TB2/DP1, HVA22 family-domain-containing protein [Choanephora cucurbitarum]